MGEEQKSTMHLKRMASDDLKKTYKAFGEQREKYILAAKNFFSEIMQQHIGCLIQFDYNNSGSGIIIDYEFEILKEPIPWKSYEDERNGRHEEHDIVKVKIHYFNHRDHNFAYACLGDFQFTAVGKIEDAYLKQLKDKRIQSLRK